MVKLSDAQRRALMRRRINELNTRPSTIKSLRDRGLIENVTEDVGGVTKYIFAGVYTASEAGRTALAGEPVK
jgi:hypothetical protein